uniref:Putative reverse transcriptase-RNaseH-integrase n=1 Tax=Moniliophthora roreri TaxID=221103 RepID=A0A0W0G1N9_MONRR
MLGEDVDNKKSCKSFRGDFFGKRNKDGLFGCMVNDDEDRCMTIGIGELFNEVKRDRIPRSGWNSQCKT